MGMGSNAGSVTGVAGGGAPSSATSVAPPMSADAKLAAKPAGSAAAVSLPGALDLKSAVEAGSKALQGINESLEFQVDPTSKQAVVKLVDTQTQEVLRQIPTPEFLQIAQNIDAFQAHLIKERA